MFGAELSKGRVAGVVAAAVLVASAFVVGPSLWHAYQNPPLEIGADSRCETGRVVRIHAGAEAPRSPKIWRDWVVWYDVVDPADNVDGFEADVYAYHIPTGETRALADGPAMETAVEIHHSTVAWREWDFDTQSANIVAHDLDTRETRTLTIPLTSDMAPRGIFEPWMLLDAADEESEGLFAFNLETEELRKLTNYSAGVSEIWGDRVVWVQQKYQSPTDHNRLFLHNLTTQNTSIILHDEDNWDLSDPDIYRDTIVYMKGSNPRAKSDEIGDWDIYGYNLSTGEEFPIATNTTGPSTQTDPRIAGDWIVFLESMSPRGTGIQGFSLPTGEIVDVARSHRVRAPDVWEDRVVFTWATDAGRDVAIRCLGSA